MGKCEYKSDNIKTSGRQMDAFQFINIGEKNVVFGNRLFLKPFLVDHQNVIVCDKLMPFSNN